MRKDVFNNESVEKFKEIVKDKQCRDRVGSVQSNTCSTLGYWHWFAVCNAVSFHFIASENFSTLNKTNRLESHTQREADMQTTIWSPTGPTMSFQSAGRFGQADMSWPRTGCGPFASTSRCSQKTSARCFTRGHSPSWGPGVRGFNRVAIPRTRRNNSNRGQSPTTLLGTVYFPAPGKSNFDCLRQA